MAPASLVRNRRRGSPAERAVLIGFETKTRDAGVDPEESVAELDELARSAGAAVCGSVLQTRQTPEAATLIGRGKVEEVAQLAASSEADLVIFDHDLSPTQQRNLERLLDLKVIDRTQLILDIFAGRARTREGRLQVELAQLNYLLPRLAGRGTTMSRLGGGIGTRGPGETKLETDRRRILRRIRKIEQDIEKVRSSRALHRNRRQSVPLPTLALVGYTNAGKSTLFNRLTAAGVLTDQRMFATLDPTVRSLILPSRRSVLLSDTVGFIRKLPTTLVRAFRATLEEVSDAALILHVVDASSPHAAAHTEQVFRVLNEIGAAGTPQLLVLNKVDRVPSEEADVQRLESRILGNAAGRDGIASVLISGLTGEGLDTMLQLIDERLHFDEVRIERFRIPAANGADIALLHDRGKVLNVEYHDGVCELEASVPATIRNRLVRYLVGVAG